MDEFIQSCDFNVDILFDKWKKRMTPTYTHALVKQKTVDTQ